MLTASIATRTENLGDEIQIVAAQQFLPKPDVYLDRDTELGSCKKINKAKEKMLLVLNGWYKNYDSKHGIQWPPNPKIIPIFVSFHIRLRICPELLSPNSISYYKKWGPIGCRDKYTLNILKENGVDAYLSRCLTLTFPKRTKIPTNGKVFVASENKKIFDYIPKSLAEGAKFVNHYEKNTPLIKRIIDSPNYKLKRAKNILDTYRNEARLVITTFLHCALPCIAMGIPVVLFYPNRNVNEPKIQCDQQRFTAIDDVIKINSFDQIDKVNWEPDPIELDFKENLIQDIKSKIAAAQSK